MQATKPVRHFRLQGPNRQSTSNIGYVKRCLDVVPLRRRMFYLGARARRQKKPVLEGGSKFPSFAPSGRPGKGGCGASGSAGAKRLTSIRSIESELLEADACEGNGSSQHQGTHVSGTDANVSDEDRRRAHRCTSGLAGLRDSGRGVRSEMFSGCFRLNGRKCHSQRLFSFGVMF